MTKIIYVDLDDTLCDFHNYLKKHVIKEDENYLTKEKWDVWSNIDDFFYNLELLDGAYEFFHTLKKSNYDIKILTALPLLVNKLKNSERDKERFVRDKLCKDTEVLFADYGQQKGILYGKPGDILIDDRFNNVVSWEVHGGTGIHFKKCYKTVLNQLNTLGVEFN